MSAAGDVTLGLISHNDARAVDGAAHAVRQVLETLAGAGGQIIWADTGSTDDTAARMREALRGQPLIEVPVPTTTSDLLEQPYHGIPGKARAMHAVMSAATRLGSRGCVIADAGSMLSPDMIVRLAEPVMIEEGLDFVSPYNARTKGYTSPFVSAPSWGARS